MSLLPLSSRTGRRRPVRTAVVVSLVVHGLVGLLLWHRRAPTPAPRATPAEVEFQVQELPAVVEPGPASGEAEPGRAAPSRPEAKGRHERRRGAPAAPHARHGETGGAEMGSAETKTPAAKGAPGDRFASFGSGRPDFSRVPGLDVPEPKRDPLAAPRMKEKAPTELPRQIRGPGGVTAQVDEDGRIHLNDPAPTVNGPRPDHMGIDGTLSLDDRLMRMAGVDPYAANKRKLAEDTHEQRLCMARRAQHAREAQALFDLSTQVHAIVGRKDWSPERRRRALFEVWDECADGDSDYAAMARATIAGIIRRAFPAGSDLAYSPQELLALNARRASRREFSPYTAQETMRPAPRLDDCPPRPAQ